jgi:hypothetical protein
LMSKLTSVVIIDIHRELKIVQFMIR